MKSTKKAAHFVLFASVTLSCVAPTHAQRRMTNFPMPSYTPPRTAPRPEPVQQPRFPQAEHRVPEQRPSTGRTGLLQSENGAQRENRPNLGSSHPNTTVVRPMMITPAIRHAMTYNTRPGGIRIRSEYFSAHYGRQHGFHFTRYAGGPCIGDCGLVAFGSEWYFNFNGGWFGIIGQLPGNWGFQSDDLYIDIGDDGNYYLYDAAFPDTAVQLTFVQTVGEDQAGAGDDQGN
jgi:hypothetical protein